MIIIRASGADFTTGLVARYPFTSNGQDSLGNYTQAFVGSGISFSSSGARIMTTVNHRIQFGDDGTSTNLSDTLNDLNTTSGTISFWITPNVNYQVGGSADNRYIFGSYAGGGVGQRGVHFGYFDQNNNLASGTGGWHFFNSAAPSTVGYEGIVWAGNGGLSEVHIVVTIDNGDFRMYKDGQLVGTETATHWPEHSIKWGVNGVIGNNTTHRMFDGWFKDLSVWRGRVLNAREVTALYTNGGGGSY